MVLRMYDKGRDDVLAQKAKDALTRCANCAQASFAILQDEFNLDGKAVLKALTPFPGIALRGETCGAVIGGLMALGLVYGRDDLNNRKGYIASLPSARRFCEIFEEMHGSTSCESILQGKLGRKFDLADRTEALEYASSGGPQVCGEVVASAVLIAAEGLRRKTVAPAHRAE